MVGAVIQIVRTLCPHLTALLAEHTPLCTCSADYSVAVESSARCMYSVATTCLQHTSHIIISLFIDTSFHETYPMCITSFAGNMSEHRLFRSQFQYFMNFYVCFVPL